MRNSDFRAQPPILQVNYIDIGSHISFIAIKEIIVVIFCDLISKWFRILLMVGDKSVLVKNGH